MKEGPVPTRPLYLQVTRVLDRMGVAALGSPTTAQDHGGLARLGLRAAAVTVDAPTYGRLRLVVT